MAKNTTLAYMNGMRDCITVAKEMETIYGKCVYEKGEILNTPYLQEVF